MADNTRKKLQSLFDEDTRKLYLFYFILIEIITGK
jgi:hypothetical protein